MGEPERLFSEDEWRVLAAELGLTRRQSQVLDCVIRGDVDRVISKRLNIAEPTVRSHMKAMFDKFGTTDRVGLLRHVFISFRDMKKQRFPST